MQKPMLSQKQKCKEVPKVVHAAEDLEASPVESMERPCVLR